MGRTGRHRHRLHKPSHHRPQPLDHEDPLINLKKFMTRNGFNNEINLKLRNFPATGRGVTCVKTLHENDILITVPIELMITYATLQSSSFLHVFNPTSKLTIHDLLATFLLVEKHKKGSFWTNYIESLPQTPPWVPALLSEQHIESLPVDLRLAVVKSRRLLEESWARIRRSIKEDWTCGCCGKNADCVFDLHSFTWGYILVNTRAVYVDPGVIRGVCNSSELLSDEPCMALCPFLDMFNHSDKARSRAEMVDRDGKLMYQLCTLTGYKKYEQVFISYGGHDNAKLLVEYGFFIPGNCYDCVSFRSEEVFKVLGLGLGEQQYKFIRKHGLDKFLFVDRTGASFNLKGFLFVASNVVRDFAAIVYTEDYPEEFLKPKLGDMCQKLLLYQLDNLKISLSQQTHPLMISFLEERHNFIQSLL